MHPLVNKIIEKRDDSAWIVEMKDGTICQWVSSLKEDLIKPLCEKGGHINRIPENRIDDFNWDCMICGAQIRRCEDAIK